MSGRCARRRDGQAARRIAHPGVRAGDDEPAGDLPAAQRRDDRPGAQRLCQTGGHTAAVRRRRLGRRHADAAVPELGTGSPAGRAAGRTLALPDHVPAVLHDISLSIFHHWEGHPPTINHPLAHALRDYQLYGGFTPGPLLLACVVLALAASLGVGRARRSGQQLACLLWLAAGLGLLLAADLYQFSWRYQLPALVTIPPAAALALSALTSPRASAGTVGGAGAGRSGRPASAVPDDPAANRHRARVEPVEGTTHTSPRAQSGYQSWDNRLDPPGFGRR